MKKRMSAIGMVLGLGILWVSAIHAEEPILPQLRISVENTAAHVQTKAVGKFADDLAKKAAGRLRVSFFHSAELYRDRDVLYALHTGKVEMAAPGAWHIDRFAPDVAIFLLPVFYGREPEANYRILSGPAGEQINRGIEDRIGVKVIGRWIDLGHAHLFSLDQKIRSRADIAGMRIRVAGGIANEMRIQALGAKPITIPWPDLPEKLSLGVVDGVLTTHETIASARLWEYGIRNAFEDRQYFPQYVPLISRRFWDRLPPDLQEMIAETWEANVDDARRAAAEAQAVARRTLLENGVEMVVPDPESLTAWRKTLLAEQEKIVDALGIRKDILALALETLREMDAKDP